MEIILFIIAAYLVGSIPTSIVLAKLFSRDDVRKSGSGNIGATNAARIHGKKFGALTFLGDMLKGFLPVWAGKILIFDSPIFFAAIGLAAFLGHLFPVYLKFKGGKGVATAFGIFLCLAPLVILVELLIFVLVAFLWRYVSLASLAASATIPLLMLAFSCPPPIILLGVVMALLIFIKHTDNIKRLISGTENRFSSKK
jgi:glycerol-3-phosphate acyltransferase PlsY